MGYTEIKYYCGTEGHPGGRRNRPCPVCGKKLSQTADDLNKKKILDTNQEVKTNAKTENEKKADASTSHEEKNKPKAEKKGVKESNEKTPVAPITPVSPPVNPRQKKDHDAKKEDSLPDPAVQDPKEQGKSEESKQVIKPVSRSITIKKASVSIKKEVVQKYFNEDGFYDDVIGETPPKPDKFPYKTVIHLTAGLLLFFLLQVYAIYFIWW